MSQRAALNVEIPDGMDDGDEINDFNSEDELVDSDADPSVPES